MAAEPLRKPMEAQACVVKLRQVLRALRDRHGVFARAHALHYQNARFWLDAGDAITFTVNKSGRDLALGEGVRLQVRLSQCLRSPTVDVHFHVGTVGDFLRATISAGAELERIKHAR